MLAAEQSAPVRSAEAKFDAARQEARAARADRLPQVAVGVDAGRYGVIENDRDYDIRGRVGMRWRLFGAADARAEQAEARARAADARASRIREEAGRDAAIAWSDVRALEEQLEALEAAYIASRRSRDVIARALPRRPRHPVRRGRGRGQLFRERDRLHPGADRIGRGALRAAIADGPAARHARRSTPTGSEVRDELGQSHQGPEAAPRRMADGADARATARPIGRSRWRRCSSTSSAC